MNGKGLKGYASASFSLLILACFLGTAIAQELTPEQQLGKSIFFDETLSINQNQACAACHGPAAGWTGPDEFFNEHGAVYEGSIPGRFGNRKPPSSAYAPFSPIFHFSRMAGGTFIGGNFWDGRATGEKLGNPAADQAQGPFLNPLEQANPDSACVVYRVCSAGYPVTFEDVWGTGACDVAWPADIDTVCATEGGVVGLSAEDRAKSDMAYDNIALSIAAYEGSKEVSAFSSKFDAYLAGQVKLTKQEREGLNLFNGKAKCARCHVDTEKAPLFTDFTYDNLGVPRNPENPFYNELEFNPLGAAWIDEGLGGFLQTRTDYEKYASKNLGKFKVPTLRNVDLRPSADFVKAYSHNGFFKSLGSIVHFYNTRDVLGTCPEGSTEAYALENNCWPIPELALNLNTKEVGDLGLTLEEEDAIVAFLKTLSDGFVP
jgi:cytochrome c peroxidase